MSDIPDMMCRKCESTITRSEWREDRSQYLTRCCECGTTTWQPKERTDGKNRRPAAHKKLVKKSGLDYCEFCLRKRSEIPAPGTLEGHHIQPFSEGGTDDMSNVLILCTACHRLCEYTRTYYGHYKIFFSRGVENTCTT